MLGRPGMKSDQTHADVQNPKSADYPRDPRSADASSPTSARAKAATCTGPSLTRTVKSERRPGRHGARSRSCGQPTGSMGCSPRPVTYSPRISPPRTSTSERERTTARSGAPPLRPVARSSPAQRPRRPGTGSSPRWKRWAVAPRRRRWLCGRWSGRKPRSTGSRRPATSACPVASAGFRWRRQRAFCARGWPRSLPISPRRRSSTSTAAAG